MHYFDSTTGQSYTQAIMEQRQAQDTGGSGSIGSAMMTRVSSSMASTWEAADDGQVSRGQNTNNVAALFPCAGGRLAVNSHIVDVVTEGLRIAMRVVPQDR